MHICVFSILKCKELKKNKKIENTVELCRVYAHSKGPFGHVAVRIHTAKAPRGSRILGASWCAARVFAVRASRRAHSKRCRWAHGNDNGTALTRRTAKSRCTAKAPRRTAASARTATTTTHNKGSCHGNERRRTTTIAWHDKGIALHIWQDARQRERCQT
jgi:hypothetical protein